MPLKKFSELNEMSSRHIKATSELKKALRDVRDRAKMFRNNVKFMNNKTVESMLDDLAKEAESMLEKLENIVEIIKRDEKV